VKNKAWSGRRHFLINWALQGRYMMTLLVPMLIMLVFFLIVLYSASQSIVGAATGIIKEEVENKIATHLQDEQNPAVDSYKAIVDDIRSYIRGFSGDAGYRRTVLISLLWILGSGILIIVIQIALLTVFFSHKIAGPVYRFETICHGLINGDYTQKVRLRKADEMQNLARLLNDVIITSNQRLIALGNAKTDEEKMKIVSSIKI
jgi:hypothetical protein